MTGELCGTSDQAAAVVEGMRLRIQAIIDKAAPNAAGQLETIPYSMEKLLEGDPDVVLITYMGDMPKIEKRLQADVSNSPAWSGLRAVQNKQVSSADGIVFAESRHTVRCSSAVYG